MKKIRNAFDIIKEKEKREKEEAKQETIKDIRDIVDGVFPKKKKEKKVSLFKVLGALFLLLFFATFISGCIWLLKFFLGGIF